MYIESNVCKKYLKSLYDKNFNFEYTINIKRIT